VTRRSAAGRLAIGLAGALIAGGVSWWVDGRDGEGTTVPLDMFLLLAALNVIMVIRDAARSAPQDGGAPRHRGRRCGDGHRLVRDQGHRAPEHRVAGDGILDGPRHRHRLCGADQHRRDGLASAGTAGRGAAVMTRDDPPRPSRAGFAVAIVAVLATVPLAWLADQFTGAPADAGQVMLFAAGPIALVLGLLGAHRITASRPTAAPAQRGEDAGRGGWVRDRVPARAAPDRGRGDAVARRGWRPGARCGDVRALAAHASLWAHASL
jgi:hypothetical protein